MRPGLARRSLERTGGGLVQNKLKLKDTRMACDIHYALLCPGTSCRCSDVPRVQARHRHLADRRAVLLDAQLINPSVMSSTVIRMVMPSLRHQLRPHIATAAAAHTQAAASAVVSGRVSDSSTLRAVSPGVQIQIQTTSAESRDGDVEPKPAQPE